MLDVDEKHMSWWQGLKHSLLTKTMQVLYKDEPTYKWKVLILPNESIAFSFAAKVAAGERGKGIGQEQHKARLDCAKEWGCTYMLCTVAKHNEVQKHILKKNGWKFLTIIPEATSTSESLLYGKELV